MSNGSGARMRVVPKDLVRLAVSSDESCDPAVLEVRVEPDRFGGWQTRTIMVPPGGARRTELPRVFRAKDRDLALGKMVVWIRARYRHVRPVADRLAPPGGAG